MTIIDILSSANSNLFRNKIRTSLNILAIMVAAFTLCLSIGISSGLKNYLNTLLDSVEAPNVMIVTKKDPNGGNQFASFGDIQEYTESNEKNLFGQIQVDLNKFKSDIKSIENIVNVSPSLRQEITISYVQLEEGKKFSLSNVELEDGVSVKLQEGRAIESKYEVIVPLKLAEKYETDAKNMLGKKLKVGYLNINREMKVQDLVIVGVSTATLFTSNIYTGYDFAQEIADSRRKTDIDKTYGQIVIKLKEANNVSIEETKQKLDELGYSSLTYEDQTRTINDFLGSVQYGLLAFAAISLLAASFGIVNTMIISVLERTKEIGLSKALGMNSITVFTTFLIESILLGFWGAISGVGAAMLLGYFLNSYAASTILKDFPGFDLFVFNTGEVLTIIGIICLVCLLAGSIPSLRASRFNPIEALRYE